MRFTSFVFVLGISDAFDPFFANGGCTLGENVFTKNNMMIVRFFYILKFIWAFISFDPIHMLSLVLNSRDPSPSISFDFRFFSSINRLRILILILIEVQASLPLTWREIYFSFVESKVLSYQNDGLLISS